ncbi:MAG TPA: prepilin-type N-terminal cleavage/methylation domain-containing protein [Longimicrobium sp.]|nr:prepilin-type N-terminal cleavage/methylation domain-containing protein [Longimicrobium sp.]
MRSIAITGWRGSVARGHAGFTLVEVIVALAVAGVVVAGAYGVLSAAVDSRARTERERAAALAGPAARAALEGWLRAAANVEGGGPFVGRDFRNGPVELDVAAFAVEDGGALYPGPRRIRLWVEIDGRAPRPGLLAEVSSLRPGEPAETLSVAPAAAGLSLRYRTVVQGHERWIDAWAADTLLPEAVELRVQAPPEPVGGTGPRAADRLPGVLRIPIRVPVRSQIDLTEARRAW